MKDKKSQKELRFIWVFFVQGQTTSSLILLDIAENFSSTLHKNNIKKVSGSITPWLENTCFRHTHLPLQGENKM